MSVVYIPTVRFHDAASYLSNASSLSRVSSAVKLELYGLFKFLTTSSAPPTSRPSIFDITGRAKWDAWSSAAKTYRNHSADAEKRYLEIAQSLGWVDGAGVSSEKKVEEAQSEEDIWDKDDGQPRTGAREGLGNAVSLMAAAEVDQNDLETLHGLALLDNAEKLATYLKDQPIANLNDRDEFGYTPLHLACDRGNIANVKILLEGGADPGLRDEDGLTALQLAQIAGHTEIVPLLSNKGAE